MFKFQNDTSPTIKDIMITPIDVIEKWRLCYHLGCTVQHIARHNQGIEDLKKAEYYLTRELAHYQKQFSRCQLALVDHKAVSIGAILRDWDLPFHLGAALQYIEASKVQSIRQISLQEALRHLQAEIRSYL